MVEDKLKYSIRAFALTEQHIDNLARHELCVDTLDDIIPGTDTCRLTDMFRRFLLSEKTLEVQANGG